jgi:thiol:disulfide interchange protein DsbC
MKQIIRKSLTVVAMALATMTATAQTTQPVNPELLGFEQTLKRLYPATKFTNIRTTPVPGVYEFQMGANVTYSDASGRYFFFGRLYDMPNQQDLTETRIQEVNRVDVATLPIKDAIKTVKGDGSRVMYVFSDADCPFCKRLETFLKDMNNVTIYTFLYPLESLHPDARRKSINVWCSSNRQSAWDSLMLNNLEAPQAQCDNPLARTIELGARLGVTGTPTIFSADGRKRAGAADAASLSHWLDAAKISAK